MTYQTPTRTFVLVHHSPQEWALVTQRRLLALGCSAAYTNKIANEIERAEATA